MIQKISIKIITNHFATNWTYNSKAKKNNNKIIDITLNPQWSMIHNRTLCVYAHACAYMLDIFI